jgi:hypothetical protein
LLIEIRYTSQKLEKVRVMEGWDHVTLDLP